MKRIYKVWKVVDRRSGEVLFAGRKKDAVRFWYPRWCYSREPLDLYRTGEDLR